MTDSMQYAQIFWMIRSVKLKSKRRQMAECFRIMKTDFSARPVYLQEENKRIEFCGDTGARVYPAV